MTKDLNYLSATEIMGWQLVEMQPADDPVMVWIDPTKPGHEMTESEWTPITDLNQCFMVVEKFEEGGAEIIICKHETKVFNRGLWYYHAREGRILNTLKALYAAYHGLRTSV